jgi:G3E family GTPase
VSLQDQVASLAEISGSCVCCDGVDVLLESLSALRPKGLSVVVLEVNGTSDVPALLELLVLSKSTRHLAPPVQISVINAQSWQERGWCDSLELEQVSAASWALLTHQDHVDGERLTAVQTGFQRINPSAKFTTVEKLAQRMSLQSRLALVPDTFRINASRRSIFDIPPAPRAHDEEHASHRFSAVEIPLAPYVSRVELLHSIATLPCEVMRAKGLVCFEDDPESLNLIQRADPRAEVSLLRMARTKPASSMLILVGPALDSGELYDHFGALDLLAS